MEKIFLNLKVKCLLPVEVYKVADILFACQKDGYVTYSANNPKSMHMPKEVVEVAIQTLIDKNILINPTKEGSFWKFRINENEIKAVQDMSWDDICSAPAIKQSAEIKFTHQQESVPIEECDDFDSMSTQQMARMMRMLEARIKEKQLKEQVDIMKQLKNTDQNSLPY